MKYLTQYVSGGMSDGYVAVEEDGVLKAQKLSFNGTEAIPDGATEAISNVGLFATGMDEPAYSGSGTGGAAKYYKCASVDTTSKTWTGYELVYNEAGYYELSAALTENLTYSGFTPIVGTMYNESATFTIGTLFVPTSTLDGCVFAANMQSNEAMYNGETINLDGVNLVAAPGYTDGTKGANSGSYSLDIDGANIFSDDKISFALSCYVPEVNSNGNVILFHLKNSDTDQSGHARFVVYAGPSKYNGVCEVHLAGGNNWLTIGYGWHHVAATSDSNKINIYFDGVLKGTYDYNGYGTPSRYISLLLNASSYNDALFMKDVQIYNRVLAAAEVDDLYNKAKLPTA